MTIIESLSVQHFRILTDIDISPSPQLNFFVGPNGAGKTSLLEAIHYLGTGHSFRLHLSSPLIQHEASAFSIAGKLLLEEKTIPLGVERHKNGQRQLRFEGSSAASWSVFANALPIRALSAMSDRFLLDGPKVRRQFVDWMTFHVEPQFFGAWQEMQRALKHRNAALKGRAPLKEVQLWDQPFVAAASVVHAARQRAVDLFRPFFEQITATLLPAFVFTLEYREGWKSAFSLEEALLKDLQLDLKYGYTNAGPHRADLQVMTAGHSADVILSQGQQKVLTYALHIAQGLLFHQQYNKSPVYLIDDLAAELDFTRREYVFELLQDLKAQIFITGTCIEDVLSFISPDKLTMFHVEQGVIRKKSN